jgi:septal ring factor EnvC (AmiA/AmiB activator)
VLALIGLALYFGIPAAYSRFIQPVQENTIRLEGMQTSQAQTDRQYNQDIASAQSRLETLEAQNSADSKTMATMQARLNSVESRTGDAEDLIKASTDRLDTLDGSIRDISAQMSVITGTLSEDRTTIQGLADKVQAGDPAVKSLYQELQVLKGMELITRSRLFLGQNNLGLARQDIQAALDILNRLQTQVPVYQVEAVSAVAERLTMALGNLPASPVLAADDLEIAWQQLVRGLPEKTPETAGAAAGALTVTATLTAQFTSTITMTLTPEVTLSPTGTGSPAVTGTTIPGATVSATVAPGTATPTP